MRISSWMVALFGTLISISSMVLIATLSPPLNNAIREDEAKREVKWNNHQLADFREAQADQIYALAQLATSTQTRDFLMTFATSRLPGAILAMDNAAWGRLEDEDIHGLSYQELKTLLNTLRLESADAINELAKLVDANQSRRSALRLWIIIMNILAVSVVTLKELPIWKRPSRR